MSKDPWTDPDPQPGDFDEELGRLDRRWIGRHEGIPSATLRIVAGVEGEHAGRRASDRRGADAGAEPRDS